MTILVNRRTGTTNDMHAYNLWYHLAKGTIEFSTRWGTGTAYWQGTVISTPYPDRWYHVAIVRSGSSLTAYVDGTVVPAINNLPITAGNAATPMGYRLAVGGPRSISTARCRRFPSTRGCSGRTLIQTGMFQDQDTNDVRLKGYFKLGFSQNPGDRLKNLASAAPAGTDRGTHGFWHNYV